jgi:hypothetical protein
LSLINAETRVPKGIAGLFLAGDISGRLRGAGFPGVHGQNVNVRAFFYRIARPTFDANCLATAGLQFRKSDTFASSKASKRVKFDAV